MLEDKVSPYKTAIAPEEQGPESSMDVFSHTVAHSCYRAKGPYQGHEGPITEGRGGDHISSRAM